MRGNLYGVRVKGLRAYMVYAMESAEVVDFGLDVRVCMRVELHTVPHASGVQGLRVFG